MRSVRQPILVALALACACATPGSAHATSPAREPDGVRIVEPAGDAATGAIEVSPTEIDLGAVTAGEQRTQRVEIRNRTAQTQTLQVVAQAVVPAATGGLTVRFVAPDAGDAAATWLQPPTGPISIPAGATAEVPVRIDVPHAVGPGGGRYAAIVIETTTGSTGNANGATVGLRSRIALLVSAIAPGAKLQEQLLAAQPHARRWLWSRHAVRVSVPVRNTGNVATVVTGSIDVHSLFGTTVAHLPVRSHLLLPGGSTTVIATLHTPPWLGIDKLVPNVHPGTSYPGVARPTASANPRWFIALAGWWWIVIALAVIALVWSFRWRRTTDEFEAR